MPPSGFGVLSQAEFENAIALGMKFSQIDLSHARTEWGLTTAPVLGMNILARETLAVQAIIGIRGALDQDVRENLVTALREISQLSPAHARETTARTADIFFDIMFGARDAIEIPSPPPGQRFPRGPQILDIAYHPVMTQEEIEAQGPAGLAPVPVAADFLSGMFANPAGLAFGTAVGINNIGQLTVATPGLTGATGVLGRWGGNAENDFGPGATPTATTEGAVPGASNSATGSSSPEAP